MRNSAISIFVVHIHHIGGNGDFVIRSTVQYKYNEIFRFWKM